MHGKAIAAAALLFAALGSAAGAADYTGTMSEPGVVWISDGSRPAAAPESQMKNTHKTFVPDLLVIPAGSSVRFPNEDSFFHSIYSESAPSAFDIGFYDTGPGKVVPFTSAGVVDIRCHIHGSMRATVIVVDGPALTIEKAGERYTLTNVRRGTHTLHVWTLTEGEKTSTVRV
ncbi:MAG: hypothetical protein NVSMB64_12920 [Candidatus Velthaea sp.]